MSVDTATAERVGLRRRLDELAEERLRVLSRLMYLDRTIQETLDAVRMLDGDK
jgi:hypothetical protein